MGSKKGLISMLVGGSYFDVSLYLSSKIMVSEPSGTKTDQTHYWLSILIKFLLELHDRYRRFVESGSAWRGENITYSIENHTEKLGLGKTRRAILSGGLYIHSAFVFVYLALSPDLPFEQFWSHASLGSI